MAPKSEHAKLRNALLDWLASQGPRPGDAAVAMAHVLGAMIGDSASSQADLDKGLGKLYDVIRAAAQAIFNRRLSDD
jgi:hypothetical protein